MQNSQGSSQRLCSTSGGEVSVILSESTAALPFLSLPNSKEHYRARNSSLLMIKVCPFISIFLKCVSLGVAKQDQCCINLSVYLASFCGKDT